MNDVAWMRKAIALAQKAEQEGEVPVGALIVKENQCIGEGYNLPIKNSDPTAHAEIIAMRHASQAVNNYRLVETTLYVPLEPCVMFMGAIQHDRLNSAVLGETDNKSGAIYSALTLAEAEYTNHHIQRTVVVLQHDD